MKNEISKYKNRFLQLLESEIGNVKPLLNEELPYSPFKSVTQTNPKVKPQTKENINPKNLKIGDGGTKKPKLKNDVIALQQKLINFGCLTTDTGKPTGYFGDKTNTALTKYNQQGPCNKVNGKDNDLFSNNLLKPKNKGDIVRPKTSSDNGFVITFSFPTYTPKVDGNSKFDLMVAYAVKIITLSPVGIATDLYKGKNPFSNDKTYGKLGHGGVATINSDGSVMVFEFGRYGGAKTKGFGTVVSKNLGVIAKIDGKKILNLNDVVKKIKSKTEGEGPRLPMDWVLSIAPNIDQGISYAKSVKEKDYSAFDFSISNDAANCGTFALEVVKASGVNVPDKCFPTPNMMTNEMKLFGIESGSV